MTQRGGIGTGATTEEVVKTEGPGLARTFLNGMMLAGGWFAMAGIIKVVSNALKGEDDTNLDNGPFIDE